VIFGQLRPGAGEELTGRPSVREPEEMESRASPATAGNL
jgi:hypothetical protein